MEAAWLRSKREEDVRRALGSQDFSDAQRESLLRVDRAWKRDGLALKTRYLYAARARTLALFLRKPFEDATKENLRDFLDQATNRNTTTSMQSVKGFVKVFYKALLQPDEAGHPEVVSWIQFNTRAIKTKLPSDLLTTDEIQCIAKKTTHPRDRAIIMVLYESAARASELISMRVGDVAFDEYGARATLTGKTGQRKVRLIQSVPDLQAWINCHPMREEPSAPMWLSWGHQNFHDAMLRHGLRNMLLSAVKRAGIKKRVHPHLFRHSRLTELAKQLSESELKVFAGWAADSKMAKVYIHLSGDDVDRKLLEKAGLLQGERKEKPDALRTQKCPRCSEQNSSTSQYCSRCTMPLDTKKAAQLANEQELLGKNLPRLLQILENPEIQTLLYQ